MQLRSKQADKFQLLRQFSGALLVLILFFLSHSAVSGSNNSRIKDWKYKGVAITAYWGPAFQSPYLKNQIDYYADLGINAIEFTPVWYQENFSDSEIHADEFKTVHREDLIAAINYAKKEKGLRINLKPHLELYPHGMPKLTVEEFINFYSKASPDNQQLLWRCYTLSDSQQYYEQTPTIEEQRKEACKTIMENIDPGFFWRARIKPQNVNDWFRSYKAFLEYYLDIAIKTEVDLFTVGTELVSMTQPKYVKRWEDLMLALRANADKKSSKIQFTYAAAAHEVFGAPTWEEREYYQKKYSYNHLSRIFGERWNGNYEPFFRQTILDPAASQNSTVDSCKNFRPKRPAASQNSTADLNDIKQALRRFWSLFDFISITVYFELGDYLTFKIDNDMSKLSEAEIDGGLHMLDRWRCKISELEKWRDELDLNEKPMLFGELGYRSVNYGHYKPYQSQGRIFPIDKEEVFNGENQANAYKTAFQALANICKFEGVFLWQEEIKDPPTYTSNINTSYSLIGKPAAAVIHSAFTGADSEQRFQTDKRTNDISVTSTKDSEQGLTAVPSCLSIGLYDSDDYIDRYDFDAGGGLAESSQDKKSWYAWTKFRARPISYCLLLDITDKIQINKIQSGLWFADATGGGDIPVFDSEYDWNRLLGGLTTKVSGKGITLDIDLGIGNVRENSSAQSGKYKSKQTDRIYYLFSHLEWRRRDFGDKWFPKISLDFEGLGVFNSNQSQSWEGQALKSDPYDRRRFEFVMTPSLIDIPIRETKLRLTPAAIMGYGREYGESDFQRVGLGITLGLNKQGDNTDLVTLGVGHRSAEENQWEGFLWVDLLRFFNYISRRHNL